MSAAVTSITTRVFSIMSEKTARQIVDTLLGEDYDSPGDYAARPGGPKDWLRQKHHLSKLDTSAGFKGKRLGQTDKDVEDFDKEAPEMKPKTALPTKAKSRFNWKPPQE